MSDDAAETDRPKSHGCLYSLLVLAAIIIVMFIVFSSCSSDNDKSSSDGSLGEAEVTCENMLRDQYGLTVSEYTSEPNTGSGAFTLYGRTRDSQKFICTISGATGDGTATGSVEVNAE